MFNWLKGIFVHSHDDDSHVPVVRYNGITCTGYICSKCGYKWYEKKDIKNKH